jgi:hypothetical protein
MATKRRSKQPYVAPSASQEFTFHPDMSATAGAAPDVVSFVLTPRYDLQALVRKLEMQAETSGERMKTCTFRPNLGSEKKLAKFAERAKRREEARQKKSPTKAQNEEKGEGSPVDEEKRLRTERRIAEKKRTKQWLKVPFKRAARTSIDLLVRSNGKT